jgi:hypothetical protein
MSARLVQQIVGTSLGGVSIHYIHNGKQHLVQFHPDGTVYDAEVLKEEWIGNNRVPNYGEWESVELQALDHERNEVFQAAFSSLLDYLNGSRQPGYRFGWYTYCESHWFNQWQLDFTIFPSRILAKLNADE